MTLVNRNVMFITMNESKLTGGKLTVRLQNIQNFKRNPMIE